MKSLLAKVKEMEGKVADDIRLAEQAGKERLAKIINGREEVLNDVKNKALVAGEKIREEKLNEAKAEMNAKHQEISQTVEMIKVSGEKNLKAGVRLVVQKLKEIK